MVEEISPVENTLEEQVTFDKKVESTESLQTLSALVDISDDTDRSDSGVDDDDILSCTHPNMANLHKTALKFASLRASGITTVTSTESLPCVDENLFFEPNDDSIVLANSDSFYSLDCLSTTNTKIVSSHLRPNTSLDDLAESLMSGVTSPPCSPRGCADHISSCDSPNLGESVHVNHSLLLQNNSNYICGMKRKSHPVSPAAIGLPPCLNTHCNLSTTTIPTQLSFEPSMYKKIPPFLSNYQDLKHPEIKIENKENAFNFLQPSSMMNLNNNPSSNLFLNKSFPVPSCASDSYADGDDYIVDCDRDIDVESEFMSSRRRRRLNLIVPNPRKPRTADYNCSLCNEEYQVCHLFSDHQVFYLQYPPYFKLIFNFIFYYLYLCFVLCRWLFLTTHGGQFTHMNVLNATSLKYHVLILTLPQTLLN